ncbi:phage tail protein [Variovorax boronicumulans]|uniref:phage tail protein n=1 Tax=Variovorax boronicumulans TaxID=436515 RepID=UPI002789A9AF|nr:phage tail protein [Variovorax boronicumulans]MDQ0040812.1 hypothetical protein [Variovorax boronicumulans]
MPQALAPAIISAAGATGAAATAITVAVYATTLVATLAMSNAQKSKARRTQRAQYEASIVDRMENSQSTVEPRKLVLGRTRVGGAAFYQTSVAPYNAVFVSVLALAGHEIDGVERIFFNETPVELDGDGNVTTAPWGRYNKLTVKETDGHPVRVLEHSPIPGTLSVLSVSESEAGNPYSYPNGASNVAYTLVGNTLSITDPQPGALYTITYQWQQFLSTARVFVHLGAPDQAADARMQLLLPGIWTSEHRARGVAYLECEFVYEDTSFPTGLPNVTAQVRGAKCYDPRTGNTAFTENPAVMMRHVLTHPQFGKRSNITAAEETRIIAQANACDIPISYFGTDLVPMYRAAMVVPFGAAPRDVLDDLAQAMGGEWAYAAGQFYARAGVYQAPVMNLTDADLAVVQRGSDSAVSQTPIGISPHKPRVEKINMVVARIWNQDENYLEVPLMPFRAAALVDDDGAELLQEVTMPAVFYGGQAYHICGIMLRDTRDPLTVTLPFKLRAYPLELFDSVTLTLAKYGWVAKEFRILNRTFVSSGYVMLTLKETTATIFQYGAGYLPGGSAPNSGLPKPWDIYPPAFTSITSGEGDLIVQSDGTVVNSIRVQWLPVQEASIVSGGNVEVQFLVLPNGDWRSVIVPGDATEARLTGVDDLAVVLIRGRTTNSLASSDWGTQYTVQVIGKTEPPPAIENLTISGSVLSWSLPRRVPDLAGFVFRFQYGNNTDWNSAAPLHTGLITESPYDLITRPGGIVTIMGKAQDTTGNQSLVTANIVMNLGDPPIANIIEQWDFDALGWPFQAGEQSGWTLVSGDPSADALDSLYGTDDQSFYGADLDSFYEPSAYGQMVFVTQEIPIASALAGSIMTLATQVQGTDLHIDYRFSGSGSLYGADNDSMYGPDADPFYDGPGAWQPWPGRLIAKNEVYQFRVTIGAGVERGILQQMMLTVDAPDMEEQIPDLAINALGTTLPYTKPFTSIKTVQATLQAGGSGARTVEITKTTPLAPVARALNSAGVAVSGATADFTLKGW